MRKRIKQILAGALCFGLAISDKSALSLGEINMDKVTVQAAENVSDITIDGNNINKENKNGLTYKGFGLLTANSTSDLLMDYKVEHPEKYVEMLQYLFGGSKPLMTHVKIEMGNDRNNSTGAESCTMRTEDETANVKRNAGFQLAADAKKINPNIKISILRWNTPKWANTTEKQYKWYKNTIMAAYETYGYMVDYINPNRNEAWSDKTDTENVKKFAKWIQEENSDTIKDAKALDLYKKIKFIVSDEAEMIAKTAVNALYTDEEYKNAVAAIGWHYPYSVASKSRDGADILTKDDIIKIADEMDKEVWNSENQAVFSDSAFRPANNTTFKDDSGNVIAGSSGLGGTGSALEMGNYIIKSFVESRRTHVIYQPVIGAFYQGGQYSSKELIGAKDPWSGYVRYDAGTVILSHLSKFAVTGWENEDNTAGIWRVIPQSSYCGEDDANGDRRVVNSTTGADSYMTLASPDKDEFSTLMINNSAKTKNYRISVKNMQLKDNQTLQCFETKAAGDGTFDSNYMSDKGDITADEQGYYNVMVSPFSVVTVSTLDQNKDELKSECKLPENSTDRTILDTDENGNGTVTDNEYLYADNFDYSDKKVSVIGTDGKLSDEKEDYIESRGGKTGAIARYTNVINGAFEAVKLADGNYVLRQQLDESVQGVGSAWNGSNAEVLIGDYRWMNYRANVDVQFEQTEAKSSSAVIAIRQTGGGTAIKDSSGYSFEIDKDGAWKLYRKKVTILEGTITDNSIFKQGFNQWNTLSLEGKENQITAYVNNKVVATYTDTNPVTSGRIALGGTYAAMDFDNLTVKKIENTAPYYEEFIDNMQQYELNDVTKSKLVFNDKWSHQCGQGMYVYDRTASYSTGTGAFLTYTFKGTGVDVLGYMKANKCKIKVTVDGKVVETEAAVNQAEDSRTNYSLRNLKYGEHTVTFEVVSGQWCIDAIGICSATYEKDLKRGTKFDVSKVTYTVNDAKKKTVTYTKLNNKKASAVVPKTVKYNGVSYKVTEVGTNAFSKCQDLKKVTIGANITKICKKAFYNRKKLTQITINSKLLRKIESNAISGISKKAVIKCPKARKADYKKMLKKSTGYKKTMIVK